MSTTLQDLQTENRRLRAILDGMTRVGLAKGALVELSADPASHTIQLVVCRADVDENEFFKSIQLGLFKIAELLGGKIDALKLRRTGVTAEDPNQNIEEDEDA